MAFNWLRFSNIVVASVKRLLLLCHSKNISDTLFPRSCTISLITRAGVEISFDVSLKLFRLDKSKLQNTFSFNTKGHKVSGFPRKMLSLDTISSVSVTMKD